MNSGQEYVAPEETVKTTPPQTVRQDMAEKPAKPPKRRPTGRRVGTVTFGLTLIAAGLTLFYSLFAPDFSLVQVLKWAPLILVALGVEILLNYVFRKGQDLRYDFLSGLVCFLLVVGALGSVLAMPLYDIYGPPRDIAERQVEARVFDLCYDNLQNNTKIASMNIDVNLNRSIYDLKKDDIQLQDGDWVYANISLKGGFQKAEEFAAYAKEVLVVMQDLPISFDGIYFSGVQGNQTFSLEVRDRFQANLGVFDLTQLVAVSDFS